MLWPKFPAPLPDDERPPRSEIAARILERVADEHARSHAVFVGWLQARRRIKPGESDDCRFVPWEDRGL